MSTSRTNGNAVRSNARQTVDTYTPVPTFSAEELLLDALRTAVGTADVPAGYLSTQQLADALDWPYARVDRMLTALFRRGRLQSIRVQRPARDGTRRLHTFYGLSVAE